MCKYCKVKTINKEVGEKTTNGDSFLKIKDGHQILEVFLDRYIVEDDGIHRQQITLNHSVDMGANVYTLFDKSIPIKYCPFCGEKL